MAAAIEVCKLFMQSLPNIEMTSFLVILFTLRMGRPALYAIPVFVIIEGLFYGFGLWWVMYLYAWPLLALVTRAFSHADSAFFWACVSGVFGLLFGLMCAVPYFFIGLIGGGFAQGLRQMFAWWVAGIPFDLIHGVSNFVIMLVLYRPIGSLLKKMPQIIAR
jgi:energy-coupling factor transport system substrate-specific component